MNTISIKKAKSSMGAIFEHKYYNIIEKCVQVIFDMVKQLNYIQLIGLVTMPFISSFLNIYVNRIIINEIDNYIKCIIINSIYNYIIIILCDKFLYYQFGIIFEDLIIKIQLSKLYCGISIPSIYQKKYKDLIDDKSKLRDFLYAIPILYRVLISFIININNIKLNTNFPIKIFFTVLCIGIVLHLSYVTDNSVYERSKPTNKTIIKFDNTNYVKTKLSMNCSLNPEHEKNKRIKRYHQITYQKYFILFLNIFITAITLINKDISLFHSLTSIIWMLGHLSDNIKSFQYYNYVSEFFIFIKYMNKYKLICGKEKIQIEEINEITFIDASFGYYSGDLENNPTKTYIINKLSYTFQIGNLYYLEAPNGIGKSTIMRMFLLNLFDGEIYFGSKNRKDLTFTNIYEIVHHVVQASEFTPSFSKDELLPYKGKDEWLEEQLLISDLLDRDTIEMSGGQRKRVILYILLTSNSPVLLLDEILSELSTEDIPEVPEGGGWLSRVINTIIKWEEREKKIIILVGHGLRCFFENKNSIIHLSIDNNNPEQTIFLELNK